MFPTWRCVQRFFTQLGLGVSVLFAVGCGGPTTPSASFALHGSVHGGQQPVSGSTIQLYAAGSGGYGSAATALLTISVVSDASGGFTITDDYTCPSASTQVYLVASGGNPGLSAGTNNSALALMAALGPCGNLGPSTFINIDEVTTVASVFALAQFMLAGGGANLGGSSTNAQGLANAFATVNNLANTANGTAPGPTLPSGATAPTSELNTLADLLATCVNSNGETGECSALFSAATPSGGSAPANTIDAILDIAQNPGNNVSALYNLLIATPPFQPTLGAAPNDWTVAVSYTGGGMSQPGAIAVDGFGNTWIPSSLEAGDSGAISEFSANGTALSGSAGFTGGGLMGCLSVAVDTAGMVWVYNVSGATVSEYDPFTGMFVGTGFIGESFSSFYFAVDGSTLWITNSDEKSISKFDTATGTFAARLTGNGLDAPTGVAVDASHHIWVANATGGSVSEFNSDGSPVGNYASAGLISGAWTVAIDASGNAWVANWGNNVLTEFSPGGVSSAPISGGGLSGPHDIAVDGDGNVWVTNFDGGTVSEFSNSGTAISPSTGYSPVLSQHEGLSIDGSGNLWIPNFSGDTLTEIVGAAAPVVTPLATAVKNNKLGRRP